MLLKCKSTSYYWISHKASHVIYKCLQTFWIYQLTLKMGVCAIWWDKDVFFIPLLSKLFCHFVKQTNIKWDYFNYFVFL